LDYKTTQLRLMSSLASFFAIHFAGDSLMKMYKRMNNELEHKDVRNERGTGKERKRKKERN